MHQPVSDQGLRRQARRAAASSRACAGGSGGMPSGQDRAPLASSSRQARAAGSPPTSTASEASVTSATSAGSSAASSTHAACAASASRLRPGHPGHVAVDGLEDDQLPVAGRRGPDQLWRRHPTRQAPRRMPASRGIACSAKGATGPAALANTRRPSRRASNPAYAPVKPVVTGGKATSTARPGHGRDAGSHLRRQVGEGRPRRRVPVVELLASRAVLRPPQQAARTATVTQRVRAPDQHRVRGEGVDHPDEEAPLGRGAVGQGVHVDACG